MGDYPSYVDRSFASFLKALLEEERATWEQKEASVDSSQKGALVAWGLRQIDEKELEYKLQSVDQQSVDFSRDGVVMFLRPVVKDAVGTMIPVMIMEYRKAKKDWRTSCLSIRVGMLSIDDEGYPRGLGFRIESPSSYCSDTEGSAHDFYHAQLLNEFGDQQDLLCLPDWIPETQPSFPLRAYNPIDALSCLMLTLYGLHDFRNFLTNHGSEFRQFMSRCREICKAL